MTASPETAPYVDTEGLAQRSDEDIGAPARELLYPSPSLSEDPNTMQSSTTTKIPSESGHRIFLRGFRSPQGRVIASHAEDAVGHDDKAA